MNPLTNVKNLNKLIQRELELGLTNKKSWHDQYRDSAWIFVGGLPYDLSEGDVVCIFSQYGEVVNINLVRDQKTGKPKGFCFICFEDQRSTILTVDNMNGAKVLERTLRVDHVENYKKPKETGEEDEITKQIRAEGIAPRKHVAAPRPASPAVRTSEDEKPFRVVVKKEKQDKKKKDKKKKKKKHKKSSSDSDSSSESETRTNHATSVKVKKEKHDPGYNRALGMYSNNSANRPESRGDKKHSVSRKGDKRNYSPDNERDYKYNRPEKHDDLYYQNGKDQTGKKQRVRERSRDRDECRNDGRKDEYTRKDRYETSDQSNHSTQGRGKEKEESRARYRDEYDDRDRKEKRDRDKKYHDDRDRSHSNRDRSHSDHERPHDDRDRSYDRSKTDRHRQKDR